jgi:dsDNA-binding SOS-regulon protein
MINLDTLRDKLDNMLNQETADSLNEWLNNKRTNMNETARFKIIYAINHLQSLMNGLTEDELDALIDELKHTYERYNVYAQSRNGDKPE